MTAIRLNKNGVGQQYMYTVLPMHCFSYVMIMHVHLQESKNKVLALKAIK